MEQTQIARIFVGIKVPAELADELALFVHGLDGRAIRPVAAEDIHLTLVPPSQQGSVPTAIEKLRGVASRFGPFVLTFRHVGYGPLPKRPRLVWVACAPSGECSAMRAALLTSFEKRDERPFRPHATLARIRGNGSALVRKYPLDADISLAQRVESIELFQSPPPGTSGYRVLASVALVGPSAATRFRPEEAPVIP